MGWSGFVTFGIHMIFVVINEQKLRSWLTILKSLYSKQTWLIHENFGVLVFPKHFVSSHVPRRIEFPWLANYLWISYSSSLGLWNKHTIWIRKRDFYGVAGIVTLNSGISLLLGCPVNVDRCFKVMHIASIYGALTHDIGTSTWAMFNKYDYRTLRICICK